MKNRWIMVVAAAGAVALLAVPLLLTSRPGAAPAVAPQSASCKAEGAANFKFTLKDMTGAPVSLTDFKGKVVLMNFWGTWCGPCRLEIPEFIELQEAYRDKGFTILGIAIEDTPEAVRAYSAEAKMNYPLLMNQEDVEMAYGPILGVPMSFVIARDGAICKKHFGPLTREDAEQAIKPLL